MRSILFIAALLAAGCKDKEDTAGATACDTSATDADNDGDGYTIDAGDCDDCDDSVYPGAVEESETDNWDQNCDNPG